MALWGPHRKGAGTGPVSSDSTKCIRLTETNLLRVLTLGKRNMLVRRSLDTKRGLAKREAF